MAERPLILVTNDDGIHAPGLAALSDFVAARADVLTVAPAGERSATSHAITLRRPVTGQCLAADRWAIDGTPADCVYLGLVHLAERRPALVVSGINPGPNLGFDSLYSGTVAAAVEAAIHGVPALAFSVEEPPAAGYGVYAEPILALIDQALSAGLPGGVVLNVNLPRPQNGNPWRYRLVSSGGPTFRLRVVEEAAGNGDRRFWLGSADRVPPQGHNTDTRTLADGVVAVTPLRASLDDEARQREFGDWSLFGQ